jgi:hypothetical protein
MGIAMKWVPVLLLAAMTSLAQPLRVYSEFAVINPQGEAVAPESPREILSPAVVRNGFTSFQIVIEVPKGAPFTLHVGQNPPEAVKVTTYRKAGDRLELVDLPYQSDSTQVLWMDVWADHNAPVRRIKVEPQLFINDDWVVYPMEARVVEASVPDNASAVQGAASQWEAMRSFLCGGEPAGGGSPGTGDAHSRNMRQDLALAAKAPKEELQKLFGACTAPRPSNPEAYLRIRDYLLRLR